MKKLFLIVNLLLSTQFLLWAQNGSISGKVVDATTGEELIGATVLITGTTIGTITDFDGNFTLKNLSPGTYNISISFVSYETVQYDAVYVAGNEVTIINANLGEATIELEQVKGRTRPRQLAEDALQLLHQKSAAILPGLST